MTIKYHSEDQLIIENSLFKIHNEIPFVPFLNSLPPIIKGLKTNELRHDKSNIMGLRPAWIQTSLRIRAV
jgi:hypothetical protein